MDEHPPESEITDVADLLRRLGAAALADVERQIEAYIDDPDIRVTAVAEGSVLEVSSLEADRTTVYLAFPFTVGELRAAGDKLWSGWWQYPHDETASWGFWRRSAVPDEWVTVLIAPADPESPLRLRAAHPTSDIFGEMAGADRFDQVYAVAGGRSSSGCAIHLDDAQQESALRFNERATRIARELGSPWIIRGPAYFIGDDNEQGCETDVPSWVVAAAIALGYEVAVLATG